MIKKSPRMPGFVVYEDGGYDRVLARASVGSGWHKLIDKIFDKMETLSNSVRIVQVKEKYGGLRVYTDHMSEEFDKFLIEVERESFTVCEECGTSGQLRKGGWYRTLCDSHADGRESIEPF